MIRVKLCRQHRFGRHDSKQHLAILYVERVDIATNFSHVGYRGLQLRHGRTIFSPPQMHVPSPFNRASEGPLDTQVEDTFASEMIFLDNDRDCLAERIVAPSA